MYKSRYETANYSPKGKKVYILDLAQMKRRIALCHVKDEKTLEAIRKGESLYQSGLKKEDGKVIIKKRRPRVL